MVIVKLKLHQSLWQKDAPNLFSNDFKDITIIEAIRVLLKDHSAIRELCLSKNLNKKPGILYISGKTELSSLGLLDSKLEEDIEIRIVPVLHGG